jgi:hypothetical protein
MEQRIFRNISGNFKQIWMKAEIWREPLQQTEDREEPDDDRSDPSV